MSPARIDGIRDVARVAGHVARSLLARSNPDAAATLTRAFRRDLTVFGFQVGGLEELELAHRSGYPPIGYLPGRVAVMGGDRLPALEQVTSFLERGGTVVVEGSADIVSRTTKQAKARASGASFVEVEGPGVAILPKTIAPIFWMDAETRLLTEKRGLEVLVKESRPRGVALVTRGEARAGAFVHFGTAVAPWRREVASDMPRITPAEFAERAMTPAEGPLAERDATMPEPLLRATVTMLAAMATVISTALQPR